MGVENLLLVDYSKSRFRVDFGWKWKLLDAIEGNMEICNLR